MDAIATLSVDAEEFAPLAASGAATPLAFLDCCERHCYANTAYAALFGQSVAEVEQRSVAEVCQAAGRWRWPQFELLVRQALAGQEVRGAELCLPGLVTATQNESWRMTCQPVRDEGLVVGVSVQLVNISAEKRSEKRLAESEVQRRLSLEVAQMVEFSVDFLTGRIQNSLEHLNFFGAATDALSTIEQGFALVHADDLKATHAALQSACDPNGSGRYRHEFRLNTPDGSFRWLVVSGQVEFAEFKGQRRAVAFRGVCLDVTPHKQAQQVLERAGRLTMLSSLSAGLAHDILNPLCAAWNSAHAALLARGGGGDDVVSSALHNIIDSVQHCRAIVENLRNFARQESLPLEMQNLNAVVRKAVEQVKRSHPQASVTLGLAPGVMLVPLDSVGIQQVVGNLVENALRSAERPVNVVVRTAQIGQSAQLTVEDDGRGMTPAERERAFEPFYSTRPDSDGLGLGLCIVEGIVSRHGGQIEIDSQPGAGTQVQVRLPLNSVLPEVKVA